MSARPNLSVAATLAIALAAPALAQEAPAVDISRYDRGWHIVRPGENLHFITRKYLGDKQLWQENWQLNPGVDDPDVLEPGQRIEVLIERQDSVPTARLRSLAGSVDGKAAPIDWNPARELDLMLEEDGLRTGRRASTEMEFQDGTRVRMTEDSVVYLRRRGRRLVGLPPRAVEIVEGQAEVAATLPAGSDQAIEILVGGTRAVSRPDESGTAQTRARRSDGDGAKVMVYEGGGEVESGGQKVAVARGMGTSVERGKPPAPPEKLLPAPSGLQPPAGTELTFNNVQLAWSQVKGADSYTVELCRDPECGLLVERRVGLGETSWEPEAPATGDYFWRVTAVSPSGLDGYPSPAATLGVRGGADRTGPSGSLAVLGRQLRYGERRLVDENVRVEPRLVDAQSGVAGWQPVIDGAEVSRQRWDGPWPDGTYEIAVRATDRVGNLSVIAAAETLFVDALPPVVSVAALALGDAPSADRSRCGWLVGSDWRWRSTFECRWLNRELRRWSRRGWSWLEVSVDGERWSPLVAAGSEPARAIERAGYRLPESRAARIVNGADPQLLLRAVGGPGLLGPSGGAPAAGLRIHATDAGAGVERLELTVDEAEAGKLRLSVEAADAMGHAATLTWSASPD